MAQGARRPHSAGECRSQRKRRQRRDSKERAAPMSKVRFIEGPVVKVDAVLARVRMPAESLAALSTTDRLDIVTEGGSEHRLEFVVEGKIVAVASVEVVDGQLIATIINNGPGRA